MIVLLATQLAVDSKAVMLAVNRSTQPMDGGAGVPKITGNKRVPDRLLKRAYT